MKEIDISGQKFNRLTAIKKIDSKKWLFRCDCGKEIISNKYSVMVGDTKSCGCYNYELKKSRKIHGETGSRLHNIFCNMHSRCSKNIHGKNRKNYYDRGIRVCKEWENFLNFKNWAMSNGYSDDLTIDRIDVNGNYCPENCRWATQKEQQNNKRSNHHITLNGERKTLKEWLDIIKISRQTFYNHKKLYGWTDVEALTNKLTTHKRKIKLGDL